MIALILELIIATAIAAALLSSGHPIMGIMAWILIMGASNAAMERK